MRFPLVQVEPSSRRRVPRSLSTKALDQFFGSKMITMGRLVPAHRETVALRLGFG